MAIINITIIYGQIAYHLLLVFHNSSWFCIIFNIYTGQSHEFFRITHAFNVRLTVTPSQFAMYDIRCGGEMLAGMLRLCNTQQESDRQTGRQKGRQTEL